MRKTLFLIAANFVLYQIYQPLLKITAAIGKLGRWLLEKAKEN